LITRNLDEAESGDRYVVMVASAPYIKMCCANVCVAAGKNERDNAGLPSCSQLRPKRATIGGMEQGFAIMYFLEEKKKSLKVLDLIHKHYEQDILSRSPVYYWSGETRRAKTHHRDASRPGRTSDESNPDAISCKFRENSKASARNVAQMALRNMPCLPGGCRQRGRY
jgi:hypothetical protein